MATMTALVIMVGSAAIALRCLLVGIGRRQQGRRMDGTDFAIIIILTLCVIITAWFSSQ